MIVYMEFRIDVRDARILIEPSCRCTAFGVKMLVTEFYHEHISKCVTCININN
jgi:hypothetical protein